MSERPVATDALATLGTIIDETAKRDAIHLAVMPVIAGERIAPGNHVEIVDRKAFITKEDEGLGIADPFLTKTIRKGERFWLVIYPRIITSLRHVWSHPDIPDETPSLALTVTGNKAESEAWIRDYIQRSNCPAYDTLITEALENSDGEYLYIGGTEAHGDIDPALWDNIEVVTGQRLKARPLYFSCSC